MTDIDPRLRSALAEQFEARGAALAEGARRVGWKLGTGDRERLGEGPVIGYLTSATRLASGGVYRADGARSLAADAEVAVEMGADLAPDADLATARRAIAGFGAALEIVDLAGEDDAQRIVAENVYHRAVALGDSRAALPAGSVEAELIVNGDVRDRATATTDPSDRVLAAARLLGAMGERLRAGDHIITGLIVQVPIAPGDEVTAALGALGRVTLTIAP